MKINMINEKTQMKTSHVNEIKKSHPDIGVMILFHEKVEQTIECVKSVLPANVNIYILNNNSSAASRNRLGQFCKDYQRINIFDSEVNLGVGVGRNYLLSHTTERWLLFMDNDIIVNTDDWFEKINSYIDRYTDIEAFIPRLFNIHENSYVSYNKLTIENKKVYHQPLTGEFTNVFFGGASFVSRNLFERLGFYDDKIFIELEDFEFAIRGIYHNSPVRAMLISDIELVHDHRKVSAVHDKKAVLNRYNMSNGEKSLNRIAEKYKDLVFVHEWRPWVSAQIDKLIPKENINLTATTPMKNFGCMSGSRAIPLINDDNKDVRWQTEVYTETLKVAQTIQAQRVIKLGIGRGVELSNVFSGTGIETIEIDSHLHLNDYWKMDDLFSQIKADSVQLYLLSGIIECLSDPRPLLRTLRRLLLLNPANRMVISTPDRGKNHGDNYLDIPNNPSHVREWTLNELLIFLESSGFTIQDVKDLRVGPQENQTINSLVTLSLTKEEYDIFLQSHYLPQSDMEYLILTAEHGKACLTGGIGSYVEEMRRILPENQIGICTLGKGDLVPEDYISKQEKLILPLYFFDSQHIDRLSPPDIALSILEQIVYFYPNLRLVESQDIEGYGFRIAQAKLSGLLPSSLLLKIRCHGTRIYLENNTQKWLDLHCLTKVDEEKMAVGLSDIISFPTDFLFRMYLNAGYDIDINKTERLRYPFAYKSNDFENGFRKIDTLIFFGKRLVNKGFTSFTDGVKMLIEDTSFTSAIKRIILLGPKFDFMHKENEFIDSLKSRLEIIELSLKREDAISTIANNAATALCVMPYLNDNHPNSVLETVNAGCQLLAAKAGGIPELIPEEFHSLVLCEPDAHGIAEGIKKAISLPVRDRESLVESLFEAMLKEQELINNQNRDILNKISSWVSYKTSSQKGKATVIVPCYRTDHAYIGDLVYGLNQQSLKPEKVIFIDDGSGDEYVEDLRDLISKELTIPFDLISHPTTLGAAAVKNSGLKLVHTDYIVCLEPYNIPKTDFIRSYISFLDNNPEFPVVTSYYASFDDKSDWQDYNNIKDIYRPLGDFSMILGQITNDYGHGSSAYRTDYLKNIGGWDDSERAGCSDWALFLKIKSHGGKIGVVPKPILLHRNHLEGEKEAVGYQEQRMLALNTSAISKFDAFRLQSMMRHYKNILKENESILIENNHLKQEYNNSRRLQQTKALLFVRELEKHPVLMKLISLVYKFMARIYKRGITHLAG